MHAPMPELDEVAVSCGKIWTLWDDEADKIQTIFRDIGKKHWLGQKQDCLGKSIAGDDRQHLK